MNVLSIQSHVAYGHVGNSAATFALQRLGVEVWPVHSVAFSNHTGYGSWRGRVCDGAEVRELVAGIEERGVFPACAAVLSGYVGSVGVGEAILDAVKRVKQANAAALYCCDPVIGDAGKGEYVKPGVADLIARGALPLADLATPNGFELGRLSGRASRTLAEALAAVAALHALGPRCIVVTSLEVAETSADTVELLASDGAGRWRLRTPRLAVAANGAGDLFAALLAAHYLRTRELPAALESAAASVFGILRRTQQAGTAELALIAAQDEIVAPTQRFSAERL